MTNLLTHSLTRLTLVALVLVALVGFVLRQTQLAEAGGVVTNCANDTELANLLNSGGLITFNCGGTHAPATINFSSTHTAATDTLIDGGGIITLNAQSSFNHFLVNSGATLT